MSELLLIYGAPSSGKTTLLKKLFSENILSRSGCGFIGSENTFQKLLTENGLLFFKEFSVVCVDDVVSNNTIEILASLSDINKNSFFVVSTQKTEEDLSIFRHLNIEFKSLSIEV